MSIMTENCRCVYISAFYGSSGEAQVGGMGQCVTQVTDKTIDDLCAFNHPVMVPGIDGLGLEAVLAPVCLIGNDNDIVAGRVSGTLRSLGLEFLYGGKDDAARGDFNNSRR